MDIAVERIGRSDAADEASNGEARRVASDTMSQCL